MLHPTSVIRKNPYGIEPELNRRQKEDKFLNRNYQELILDPKLWPGLNRWQNLLIRPENSWFPYHWGRTSVWASNNSSTPIDWVDICFLVCFTSFSFFLVYTKSFLLKLPSSVTRWGAIFQGVGNVSALNWACLASFLGKTWCVLQCINTLCCFFSVSTRCTSQGVTERGNNHGLSKTACPDRDIAHTIF